MSGPAEVLRDLSLYLSAPLLPPLNPDRVSEILTLVHLTELARQWLHRTCLKLLDSAKESNPPLEQREIEILGAVARLAGEQEGPEGGDGGRQRFWTVTVAWRRAVRSPFRFRFAGPVAPTLIWIADMDPPLAAD